MGNPRQKPRRLAEKLRQIRLALGLSQTEMHKRLEVERLISYTQISKYESGLREPLLMILLRYAEVAGLRVLASPNSVEYAEVVGAAGKNELFSSDPERVQFNGSLDRVEAELSSSENDPKRIGV